MNSDDVLEVRVIGLYGRTSYKAKAAIRDKKRINEIMNTLMVKFDLDPIVVGSQKGWFD